MFGRGLLNRLFTRAYLPDPGPDALLDSLPAGRRDTLIAQRDQHGLRFDIRLQGEAETVFLRFPPASERPVLARRPPRRDCDG